MDHCHLLGALIASRQIVEEPHDRKSEEDRFYELHGKDFWSALSVSRAVKLVIRLLEYRPLGRSRRSTGYTRWSLKG